MSEQTKSSGVGIGTVLFVVFLVLKLTHNIDWSWWWVTSPIWIPLVLVMGFFIVMGIVMAIVATIDGISFRRNQRYKRKFK